MERQQRVQRSKRPGQPNARRLNIAVTGGTVGALNEPLSLQRPTGFRTDNARFEFQYYADRPTNAQTRRGAPGPEHCVMSEGD
jgi:hypothetical protein